MDGPKPHVRLLIINDQQSYCELLQESVELNSHLYDIECRCVETGAEALKLISAWAPSVVLLDAFINDMNSFDLVRRCYSTHLPVVVVSALGSAEIERSAKQHGAAAYVPGAGDPESVEHILDCVVRLAADRGETH